jgi:hypothetical protein
MIIIVFLWKQLDGFPGNSCGIRFIRRGRANTYAELWGKHAYFSKMYTLEILGRAGGQSTSGQGWEIPVLPPMELVD